MTEEFLDLLRPHPVITVVGPQRSGTRIATAMIASDLGRTFVGEEEFMGVEEVAPGLIGSSLFRLFQLMDNSHDVVIHAPALTSCAHFLPGMVVCMTRDAGAVAASAERIAWPWEKHQLGFYFTGEGDLVEVVRRAWAFQAAFLGERGVTLSYESLEGHPMWVDKPRRAGFHPHQISTDGARHP